MWAELLNSLAGIGKGIGSVVGDNKDMLAQYLAAAGTDLNTTGSLGANFNGVTSQIGQSKKFTEALSNNKNISDLFSIILSQGGSFKADGKGFNFSLPSIPGIGQKQQGTAPTQMDSPMPSVSPTAPGAPIPQQSAGLNSIQGVAKALGGFLGKDPFSVDLSGMSSNDLVGLTPELIMQVIGTKFKQGEMYNKSLNDISDMLYKQGTLDMQGEQNKIAGENAITSRMRAETAQANAIMKYIESNRQSPLDVPGVGQVTADQFDKLPETVQTYAYYAYQQQKTGQPIMPYEQFINQPSIYQIYKLGIQDKEFKKFYMQSQEAGATKLNLGPYGTKKEGDRADREGNVVAPEYIERITKRAQDAVEDWDDLPETQAYAAANPSISRDERAKINSQWQRVRLIRELDADIKQAYAETARKTGRQVKMLSDGWYLVDANGAKEFIRSIP